MTYASTKLEEYRKQEAEKAAARVEELREERRQKLTPPARFVAIAHYGSGEHASTKTGSFPASTSIGDIVVWSRGVSAEETLVNLYRNRGSEATRIVLTVDEGNDWEMPTMAEEETEAT